MYILLNYRLGLLLEGACGEVFLWGAMCALLDGNTIKSSNCVKICLGFSRFAKLQNTDALKFKPYGLIWNWWVVRLFIYI